MSDQLRSENRGTLVGIASLIAFPYLWLGLFVFLAWLYHIGFFGRGLGSIIILGLLGLLSLIPAVPLALTKFLVRPLFSNLLGREVITVPGCVTGLVSVVSAGFAAIYFLSRGTFGTAGLLLLAAPLIGGLLAGGVSLIARGGGVRLPGRRRSAPEGRLGNRPPSKLPGGRSPSALPKEERSTLPASQRRPQDRSPVPRGKAGAPPSRRPPPPRRK
jgi:hypothetical protein